MKLAAREASHYTAKGDSVAASRSLALGERAVARQRLALPSPAVAPSDTRGLAASIDMEALEQGLSLEELALMADFEAEDKDLVPSTSTAASRSTEATSRPGKRPRGVPDVSAPEDGEGTGRNAEDAEDAHDDADSDDDDSSSDDDEEQEAALMAELARVRAEREQEAAKRREEEEAAAAEETEVAAASSNPLLSIGGATAGGVRRRWDEDVVFRSQVQPDNKPRRRFINDTLRNDFHKSFMRRYVQ